MINLIENSSMVENSETETLLKILDLARWAPSADNIQPWRFEILSGRHLLVHGSDRRHSMVYDREGFTSQIAIGALLESISIAASEFSMKAEISYRLPTTLPDEHPLFDIYFVEDPSINQDPLFPYIKQRSVNRFPMGTNRLTGYEKEKLSKMLERSDLTLDPYKILWLEKLSDKIAVARITQSAGKLRLIIPEAYPVHRAIIEWNAQYSMDRIPDRALGLSRSILPLMQWIMESWERVVFFNRFFAGTLIPRFELDIIPALACSTHFIILNPKPPQTLRDYIAIGRIIYRFWLGVTALGLQLQPEMAPLLFRTYAIKGEYFSRLSGSLAHAQKISSAIDRLIGREQADQAVFMGRIGRGNPPSARSVRLPLSSILLQA